MFVGLKSAQASRVSVYLSAFTFLSVAFTDFFDSLLICFLDKAGVFVGSSIVVPPVFPFFFTFLFLGLIHGCDLRLVLRERVTYNNNYIPDPAVMVKCCLMSSDVS